MFLGRSWRLYVVYRHSSDTVFISELYREVRLQSGGWESCLAFFDRITLQKDMVRRLYLGRDIVVQQPMPKTVHKDITNAIEGLLRKQGRLVSV